MADAPAAMPQNVRVRLNVGGTPFHTSLHTLMEGARRGCVVFQCLCVHGYDQASIKEGWTVMGPVSPSPELDSWFQTMVKYGTTTGGRKEGAEARGGDCPSDADFSNSISRSFQNQSHPFGL